MMPLVTCRRSGTRLPLFFKFSIWAIMLRAHCANNVSFLSYPVEIQIICPKFAPSCLLFRVATVKFPFRSTLIRLLHLFGQIIQYLSNNCRQKVKNINAIPKNRSNSQFFRLRLAHRTNFVSCFQVAVLKIKDVYLFHPQIENCLASCSRATTCINASRLRSFYKKRNSRHTFAKKLRKIRLF